MNADLTVRFVEPISKYKNLWLSPKGTVLEINNSSHIVQLYLQSNYRIYDFKTKEEYDGRENRDLPSSIIQDIQNNRFYSNRRYIIEGFPKFVIIFRDLKKRDDVLDVKEFPCEDLTVFTERYLVERLYAELEKSMAIEEFMNYTFNNTTYRIPTRGYL